MKGRIFKISLILSIVLFLWAWLQVLSVGFLADDYEWFPHVVGLPFSQVWKLFWYPALGYVKFVRYRPLAGLLFWVDYKIWNYNPIGFHLTNLFFHLVSVAGVFLLSREIWNPKSGKKKVSGNMVGFLTASLFAVNPFFTEAVTWVDGRYDVLASALLLWSLVFLLRGLKNGSKSLIIRSLVLGSLSLLAKETALILPVYIIATIIYIASYKYIKRYLLILVYRKLVENKKLILTSLLLVAVYLFLSFVSLRKPFWISPGYSYSINRVFAVWMGISILAVGLRFIFGKKWNRDMLFVWLLVGFSLLPVALLPTQLRFLYLPTAFFSIAFIFGIIHYFYEKRKGLVVFIWLSLILLFSWFLRRENISWVEASSLHQEVISDIAEFVEEYRPKKIFVFNLPDSVGRVQVFRSYTKEAVEVELWPDEYESDSGLDLVVGPTTINLGDSKYEVVDNNSVRVTSSSGFMVFEPTVVESFEDGSVLEDWKGLWRAKISADRREAEVLLPIGLDEEGVVGLVFEGGKVVKLEI